MQTITGILLANAVETSVVEEQAANAEKKINYGINWLENKMPDMISFGIKVVLCFILFFIGKAVIGWVRKLLRRSLDRTNAEKGIKQFLDSLVKFGLYTLLAFLIAISLGVSASAIAALLASVGVAVGLALQGSLSNLAGGVLILLTKPFAVGDYIIEDTHNNEGWVKEIRIFHTKLMTLENKMVIIPNGVLVNASLTNVTAATERKLDLRVGISYQADLKKAKQLLIQLMEEDPYILQEKEHLAFVSDLGDSAVVLGLRAFVPTEQYSTARWGMLEKIKESFDENGIEIPYNQLTVHMEKE